MAEDVTVIDTATTIVANITGAGDLVVRGRLQGTVSLQGKLQIEPGAEVQADVDVGEADIGGDLRGDLQCSGRVILRREGRVIGQLRAGRLVVEPGAIIQGEVLVDGDGDFASPRVTAPEPTWRETISGAAREPVRRPSPREGARRTVDRTRRASVPYRSEPLSSRARASAPRRDNDRPAAERPFPPRSTPVGDAASRPRKPPARPSEPVREPPIFEDHERVIEPVDVEPPGRPAEPVPSRRKKMAVRTRRTRKDRR